MSNAIDRPQRLETVLVTGASRGIGLALCERLLQDDYQVIATHRSEEPPGELKQLENGTAPGRLSSLRMDLLDEASVLSACERFSQQFDQLDVLVNNAGWMPDGSPDGLEDLDLATLTAAFESNVVTVARVTRIFLPFLRHSRRPRILNHSSRAGSIVMKDDFSKYAYSISKTALNMLTVTMANELRADNIVVTAVSPGWVRTRMGGANASLEPHESAESLARLIPKLAMEYSGEFFNRDGNEKLPW